MVGRELLATSSLTPGEYITGRIKKGRVEKIEKGDRGLKMAEERVAGEQQVCSIEGLMESVQGREKGAKESSMLMSLLLPCRQGESERDGEGDLKTFERGNKIKRFNIF